jgi:hypothetical protein
MRQLWSRFVVLAFVLPLITGCSTHFPLVRESDNRQVIYRISEEQAFRIALDAFAEILPKQSLYDLTGPRRGYQSTWRWGPDTYSQRVFVIPAVGNDGTGQEVRGYWFEVSGKGTSGSGWSKNRALHQRIQEALDATGTAVRVTNLKEGRYETDGRVYRTEGQDAGQMVPPPQQQQRGPSSSPAIDQLRELKKMHDEGLITKDEYEAKRRQILDRM